jgi:hypothetical protein
MHVKKEAISCILYAYMHSISMEDAFVCTYMYAHT